MQQKIAREARWTCFSFLNLFGLIVLRKHIDPTSNVCLQLFLINILLVIFFGPDRKGGKITKKLPPSAIGAKKYY